MSIATDIITRADENSGIIVNYKETTTWYDGSPITDFRVDGDIFRKKGNTYYQKTIDQNTLLKINTIADLRLQNGYYEGQEISLLGYYQSGDKDPVIYKFTITNFNTNVDDGGSIIKSSRGSWIAQFNTIDIRDFGAKSDGDSVNFTGFDNKTHIEKAINTASSLKCMLNIIGSYFHSPIIITKSNLDININSGSKLISNLLNEQDKAITITGGASNITIRAYGAEVIAPSNFSSGEWRHLININHCSYVDIIGLSAKGGGGDGFYIGNSEDGKLPNNIILESVKANNSRRNGISLINGEHLYVLNPICEDINGTSPMAGIDVEPNSFEFEYLRDVKIINPVTRNCNGYGVLINVANYVNAKEKTTNITILNHTSFNDTLGLGIEGKGSGNPWNYKLSGVISYSGSIFNPKRNGGSLVAYDASKAPVIDVDMYVENPGSSSIINTEQNGFFMYASGGSTFDIGNINLKIKVRDTRAIATTYTDVYIANQTMSFINYNIIIDSDFRRVFTYCVFNSSLQKLKGRIEFLKKPIYNVSGLLSLGNSVRSTGGILKNTASSTINLPSLTGVEGNRYTLYNGFSNLAIIQPITGDSILIEGAKVNSIILDTIGQFIEMEATLDGWIIISSNFNKSNSTVNLPTVTGGKLIWFDSTLNKPIFWNGTAWIPLISPNATTSTKGVVNQSVAVTDVTTPNLVNISIADLTVVSTSDATDPTTSQALVNELKAKLNLAITLINDTKAKYNTNVTLSNSNKAQLNAKLLADRNSGQQA